jgi:poly(A) polymerase
MLKRIRALLGRRTKNAAAENLRDSEKAVQGGESRRGSPAPRVHRGPRVVHQPIAISDLDPDAVKIVRRLTRFEHRAYLVGGCVRDLLLDRKPKDFDIGTSATPRQIKRVFRNSRIIGRRFRLAHIYFQNGKIIEVATFRALDDQEPADDKQAKQDLLIRDDNVFGTPEEDALRRDFTINSLFYDLADETVIDHADGLGDLRSRLVRTIGDPDIRFAEDPIRILRAIKFAARLDFTIEKSTLESLCRSRHELDKAAPPRVLEEINRFCRGAAARRSFELMLETDVFDVVFPEITKAYARDEDARTLMLDLLGHMDEIRADTDREIRTGEIFALLLLPLMASDFGWNADGTATRPRALNVRHLIDEHLRPMAVRLRIPRREQEHCRQVLGSMYRMVPARRIRRNTKRAILSRECLPDAMWVLRLLADRLGADFAAALSFWTTSEREERKEPARPRETGSPPTQARRGRRRSRRRTPTTTREKQDAPATESKKENMPPPWDDNYFFAALPSAPEMAGDETQTNRYGGATAPAEAAAPAESAAAGDASTGEASADAPARPKRRRRRRRRGGSKPPSTASPDATADPEKSRESDEGGSSE